MSVIDDLQTALSCRTRAELAKRLGTSAPSITRWDKDGMPSDAIIAAEEILAGLGIERPASLVAERARFRGRNSGQAAQPEAAA